VEAGEKIQFLPAGSVHPTFKLARTGGTVKLGVAVFGGLPEKSGQRFRLGSFEGGLGGELGGDQSPQAGRDSVNGGGDVG